MRKGLSQAKHVQHESPITSGLKVMAKVKVLVHDHTGYTVSLKSFPLLLTQDVVIGQSFIIKFYAFAIYEELDSGTEMQCCKSTSC